MENDQPPDMPLNGNHITEEELLSLVESLSSELERLENDLSDPAFLSGNDGVAISHPKKVRTTERCSKCYSDLTNLLRCTRDAEIESSEVLQRIILETDLLKRRLELIEERIDRELNSSEVPFNEVEHSIGIQGSLGLTMSPNPFHQVLIYAVMPPKGSILLRRDLTPRIPERLSNWIRTRILAPNYQGQGWSGSDFKERQLERANHSPPAVPIRLSPFENREAIFNEIHASIALTTFLTAASFLFLGLVLDGQGAAANAGSSEASEARGFGQVDVVLLFIASFGFFFATLMYANASGSLARMTTLGYERMIERGNRTSEYFGVYILALGVPISVARLLGEAGEFASWTVAIMAIIFLSSYVLIPEASLLDRDVGDNKVGTRRWRIALALLVIVPMASALYFAQVGNWNVVAIASGVFVAVSTLLFLLSIIVPESEEPWRYEIHELPGRRD